MARFKKGKKRPKNAGRKKGTPNKTTSLKQLLQDSLDRNREKAIKRLDDMYNNSRDFKFIITLKASLEPKTIDPESVIPVRIITHIPRKNGKR